MAPWLRGVGDGEHAANSAVYDVSNVPFQALCSTYPHLVITSRSLYMGSGYRHF